MGAGLRRPNVRGQGGRLRTELLDAAERLLTARGRGAEITLRAVAREAGVAAPSIYDHFPHLDDLLVELAQRYVGELAGVVDLAACRTRDADPGARLRAAARAYLRWGLDHPGPYALVLERRVLDSTARAPEPDPLVGTRLLDPLAALVGELDPAPANPRTAAVAVWTGLHGIVSLRSAEPAFAWPALSLHLDAVLTGVFPV
jgi:AcrR family transcriptional regulator